ncbi:MAG: PBP1A family penicillin-binding protein [Gemmatimonadetes bacterium]|nr:MAG: PBP1A family penicillin-binding protein [Gemmatimonadota bacterium]
MSDQSKKPIKALYTSGKARSEKHRVWGRVVKYTLWILTALIFLGAGIGIGALKMLYEDLPSVAKLENYEPPTITKIYDINNEVLYEFYEERRIPVSLDSIPDNLIKAVIATEDRRFYDHWGVDFTGITRAIWHNILRWTIQDNRSMEGASTITQQLARNLFLTHERRWIRKIREALLSLQIEQRYSKDQILEFYFNQIYYGHGAYGVEAASRLFFNKPAREMTVPEAALIAGIPQRPALYSPYDHPDHALRRRNLVLNAMREVGYISPQEYQQYIADSLVVHPLDVRKNKAPYFVEYVRKQLERKYGSDNLYQAGYQVYTTLDANMQIAAEKAVEDQLQKIEKERRYKVRRVTQPEGGETKNLRTDYIQGALLAIDPRDGYIKVMVGGRDFYESRFNRTVQAQRQPGSAFKPFVYTAAIDNGMTPADIILDTPVVMENQGGERWAPANYDNKFLGPVTIRTGFQQSRNIVAIKLLRKMGVYTVIDYAKRFGIQSEIPPYFSIALGTSEVNMMELVAAYTTFPNLGVRVEPISIIRIEDRYGNIIETNETYQEEVISPQTAYMMVSLMQSVVDDGTARGIRYRGYDRPVGGKTGTTNDFTDGWFVGYIPQLVCGVWVGFDTKKSLGRNMSGGKVAVPIWTDFMKSATDSMEVLDFTMPEGIASVTICTVTGLLNTEFCPATREEVFIEGTQPAHSCYLHTAATMGTTPADPLNFENEDQQPLNHNFFNSF